MKRTLLLAALFAFLGLGASSLSAQNLTKLTNLLATPDGAQKSAAQLGAGKVTIVSFWATWCVPCKQEMSAIHPIYDKLKANGVEYIAVSIDNTKTMSKVGSFITSKGYNFPVLLDPNSELFRSVNGTQVPYTLVFGADGKLASKHDGYLAGDEAKLEKEVMELAAKARETK